MSNTTTAATREIDDTIPAERPQVRIRAFLARTRLDPNTALGDPLAQHVDSGRGLIEELALAFELGDELPTWTAENCADVADFLSNIYPRPGRCFCNDASDERVNITCGYHEVLDHVTASLREAAQEVVNG